MEEMQLLIFLLLALKLSFLKKIFNVFVKSVYYYINATYYFVVVLLTSLVVYTFQQILFTFLKYSPFLRDNNESKTLAFFVLSPPYDFFYHFCLPYISLSSFTIILN